MKSSSFGLEREQSLGYHLIPYELGFSSQAQDTWSMLYLGAHTFIFKELHHVHGVYSLQTFSKHAHTSDAQVTACLWYLCHNNWPYHFSTFLGRACILLIPSTLTVAGIEVSVQVHFDL